MKHRPINERVLYKHEVFEEDANDSINEFESNNSNHIGNNVNDNNINPSSSKTLSDFMKNVNIPTEENDGKINNRKGMVTNTINTGGGDGKMTVSLNTILKSLTLTEFSFSLGDMIRYTICALIVFMTLLYIFPQKLLLLFLLLVIIVLILVYIALCRKIYQLQYKPINREKLNAIRNVYFARRNNQTAAKPSKG